MGKEQAKKLQAEIEESLLRATDILYEQCGFTAIETYAKCLRLEDVQTLMRERARNLAAALADRCVPDAPTYGELATHLEALAHTLRAL